MADAITKLADVIIPTKFLPYIIERTAALSAIYASGIVQRDPEFDALASGAGTGVNMPFWTDLSGASVLMSDTVSVETLKIDGTKKDIAAKQGRQNAWAANTLVKLLAEGDPMAAIGSLIASYWARDRQAMLISSLKGVFAAGSMSGNLLAIHNEAGNSATSANQLTGSTFLDALQKLGDSKGKLTAVAMHSATETFLAKNDLIDYVPESESKAQIPFFMGRRVIVDDSCPSRAGTTNGTVYTTYLFGPGAFGEGNKDLSAVPIEGGFGTYGLELGRDSKAGASHVINRQEFVLHPRGVKWNSASQAASFPTNAELETAANWTRVYENKNVRIVAVTHNN